jgi:hypothetical protein
MPRDERLDQTEPIVHDHRTGRGEPIAHGHRTEHAGPEVRLISAEACLRIDNIEGDGPMVCVGPGGHSQGKADTTFRDGEAIALLFRWRNLPVGHHRLHTVANGTVIDTLGFANTQEAWAQWFETRANKRGVWQLAVLLDRERVGQVAYSVDTLSPD